MMTVNGRTTGPAHPRTGYCPQCDRFYEFTSVCTRIHDPGEPVCITAPCADCAGELLVPRRANTESDGLEDLGRSLEEHSKVVKDMARLAATAAPRKEEDDE
jgi:hypothetical protein